MLTPYELLIKKHFDYIEIYYNLFKIQYDTIMNVDMYNVYKIILSEYRIYYKHKNVYENTITQFIYETIKISFNYLPGE